MFRRPWWGWPFLWVLLVPFFTLPLQSRLLASLVASDACIALGSRAPSPVVPATAPVTIWVPPILVGAPLDQAWICPPPAALATLVPGLTNLLPLLSLRQSCVRARAAAGLATLLGAARVVVPALFYLTDSPGGFVLGSYQLPPTMAGDGSSNASLLLWCLSLLTALAFTMWHRIRRSQGG
jgi:hypothetical protein